jgi:hypothetical protein
VLRRPSGERLIVSAGLTYVNFNPRLTGANRSAGPVGTLEGNGRSNSEDFYRQELPVPILGLRWDHPFSPRLLLRSSVAGGGLPRVDSLRTEGGYHFTYFFQEEKSHEDKNRFELIDNGLQIGLRVAF